MVADVEAVDSPEEKPAPQVIRAVPIPSEEKVAAPSDGQPSPPDKEVYVQGNPISTRLKDAFYQSFLDDRANAAAVEKVFKQGGGFTRSDDWDDSVAAGINAIIYKGPFVEGSNWLPYRTWSFAVAAEVHLLNKFRTVLEQNVRLVTEEVDLNWQAIFAAVDKFSEELTNKGYAPSVIVIVGQLDVELMVELNNLVVPDWELPKELRALWIEGTYEGVPILNIRDVAVPHTLYVADLAAFAKLTKYSPDAKFNLDEMDEDRAREILAKKPEAVTIPSGRPDTLEEKLRLLQLRVWLRLYESYDIEVQNPEAALGAKLRADGSWTMGTMPAATAAAEPP